MSSKIRARKKKLPSSMITSLPNDIILDILARVPRFYYPTISLVSKHFRSLVSSPWIYTRRSLLGCTEACIYVGIYNYDTKDRQLYILRREVNNNRLVLIQPFPRLPYHASYVAVGTSIYVLSGLSGFTTLPDVSCCIDCRSHTVQSLPDMPIPIVNNVADFIDGKIYVTGYYYDDGTNHVNVMLVFNTETQTWESEITKLDTELRGVWQGCVVMPDKMYLRNDHNSFVYRPKENKWETNELLNYKQWSNACVLIDDVLYYYDCLEKTLRAYDTNHKSWGVVNGVEDDFLPEGTSVWQSHTVNYGGKLAVLLSIHEEHSGRIKEIRFVEIAIERREGGDIWGKVECCDVVFEGYVHLHKPLVVMI